MLNILRRKLDVPDKEREEPGLLQRPLTKKDWKAIVAVVVFTPLGLMVVFLAQVGEHMNPNYREFEKIQLGDNFEYVTELYGRVPEETIEIEGWKVVSFYRESSSDALQADRIEGELPWIYASSVFLVTDSGEVVAKCYLGEGPCISINESYKYGLLNPTPEDITHFKKIIAERDATTSQSPDN